MKTYRAPVGHKPLLSTIPCTGNHGGPLTGLCAIVIVCAMVLLSVLAVDRVASGPAACQAPEIAMQETVRCPVEAAAP